jgi:hypothetical protein
LHAVGERISPISEPQLPASDQTKAAIIDASSANLISQHRIAVVASEKINETDVGEKKVKTEKERKYTKWWAIEG